MQAKESTPKDAAAVVLLTENKEEVYLAQRNPAIKFLGGWHAFPGGKVDAEDSQIEVRNCPDPELAKFIVCAVRETFEEIGVLLVRGADKITRGQRASLRDDLISDRFSFSEILQSWGLWIDGQDFTYAGFWTTPSFSPARFKTRFFVAVCPRRQEPQTFGEFSEGSFTAAQAALARWEKAEILISPPVLITLQTLAADEPSAPSEPGLIKLTPDSKEEGIKTKIKTLLSASKAANGDISYINLNPYIAVFPLRTETLPPATHTNCFIVGEKELMVIDPASPFADQQKALHDYLDSLIESGKRSAG